MCWNAYILQYAAFQHIHLSIFCHVIPLLCLSFFYSKVRYLYHDWNFFHIWLFSIYIFSIVSTTTDSFNTLDQEEHKKLEVFAFESETRITSLEEQVKAALKEKEEIISINEGLNLELEGLTEKLNTSTSELCYLKEEISALVSFCQKFFIGYSFQLNC